MALTATMYRFDIDVSDMDRGVYETLDLRVAMHPSESMRYLVARLLAYITNLQEGLSFSKGGLSDAAEPALFVDDRTGRRLVWIEVGQPAAAKLHRASKAADKVLVYAHKDPTLWLQALEKETIHQRETVDVYAFDESFLDALGGFMKRNNTWSVVLTEGQLYVTAEDQSANTEVRRVSL